MFFCVVWSAASVLGCDHARLSALCFEINIFGPIGMFRSLFIITSSMPQIHCYSAISMQLKFELLQFPIRQHSLASQQGGPILQIYQGKRYAALLR